MAFKILNSNELLFLDDNQRINYEKELELYQQRCAFVDRLDELENATIEPYEPKLEPITAINDIEVRPFEEIEYAISISEPIQKPDVKINSFEKIEKISPVLPMPLALGTVRDTNIRKIEKKQLELPVQVIVNPSVEKKNFAKTQRQQPELPVIVKPTIAAKSYHRTEKYQSKVPMIATAPIKKVIPFESLKNNLYYMPSDMPNVMMPDMNINSVDMSDRKQPKLPEVSVRAAESRVYVRPEQHNTELPNMVQPNINVYYVGAKKVQPTVPEISAAFSLVKTEFHKPELQNTDLPLMVEPNTNIRSFEKTEYAIPSFPELSVMNMQAKKFNKPEQTEPALPLVSPVKVGVSSFKKPGSQKYHLPNVAEVDIEKKQFEKPEITRSNVAVPAMPNIAVKTFKMTEQNISELPEIKIEQAPDAYSVLQKALLV